MLLRKISIFLQRHEKPLTVVSYGFVIGLTALAIYDPDLAFRLLFPQSIRNSNSNKNKHGGLNHQSDYDLEGYLPLYFHFTTTPRTLPDLRAAHIPFVPTRHFCDDMFQRAEQNFSYSEFYWEHMDAYKSALSITDMMQEANVNEQSWAFHELARRDFVNNVCETGFYAGHNTFQWLSAKPEVTVYSFEAQQHNFTEDMAVFMAAEFPDHFYIYTGRTNESIPKFQQKHNSTKCDIIYVDSSWKKEQEIRQDIELFKRIVNPMENFFVMDAHGPLSDSLGYKVWKSLVQAGLVRDYYHCEFRDAGDMLSTRAHNVSGFFVGALILPKEKRIEQKAVDAQG